MRPLSRLTQSIVPALLCLFLCCLTVGLQAEQAEARAGSGGRSFSSPRSASPRGNYAAPRSAPNQFGARPAPTPPSNSGGFLRGMAGGLVGGALGSMLFGGLARGGMGGGMGGGGIGLLDILILGGIGYFVYVKFFKNKKSFSNQQHQEHDNITPFNQYQNYSPENQNYDMAPPTLEDGLEAIRRTEPDFDPLRFKEVASEVFFKIQAGWMRREIEPISHLLDTQLVTEYAKTFAEMKSKGVRNRLENITVRNVEIVDAGVDGGEEFITLLFTANLLDYTEEEASGRIVSGSNTEPVKFAEQWTWSRPVGSLNWKLAGIKA